MSRLQNPFNLHTVTPYLIVEDVPKLIKFLEIVFAADERRGWIAGSLRRSCASVSQDEYRLIVHPVALGRGCLCSRRYQNPSTSSF
jgi:hypothetical protein